VDNKVSVGIILCFVLVGVFASVLVFNPLNPNISQVNNVISTVNQTGNNTTSSDFIPPTTFLTFIPFSGVNSPSSSAVTPPPSPEPSPDPMDNVLSIFDAYFKSKFIQSGIPAAAVVIVQNDKIIYMNCLGIKDLASGEPVDENTLFGICSLTKQFSAINVAQYVSNGLMSWDDPIIKYFSSPSEFQLYSNEVTNNFTIRDCLTMHSGLEENSGDDYYTYFNESFSTSLYNLRYIENITPFRSSYAYQNLLYALAGFCAAKANNNTWNELIKRDLLDPLGMTTTKTSYWDFINSSNHVTPYTLLKNGTLQPYDIIPDGVGPAGSLYMSISEMANWLKFQIADTGYYNSQKILNKTELDETRTGQTNKNTNPASWYCMGWHIRADGTLYHEGASVGQYTHLTLYPSKGLAIAIFTNGGEYGVTLKKSCNDKFKNLINGDFNTDTWTAYYNWATDALKPKLPTPPIVDQTLPLTGYVGVYDNDLFGNINITTSDNSLFCQYGTDSRTYELKHWNYDVFEEQNNNHFFNFTDIYSGTSHKVDVKLTNTPDNVTFNRTETP